MMVVRHLNHKVVTVDQDLATILIGSCVKAARDIGDLAHVIPKERDDLKQSIAEVVFSIHANIIDRVVDELPELKIDMERRLAKYGRLI